MRLCSGAGCGRKIEDGVRFCDECRAERNEVSRDDSIKQHEVSDRERYGFLYTAHRWNQVVRRIVIGRQPLCDRCNLRVSEIVDHIVPCGVAIRQVRDSGRFPFDRYAGFYIMSNLHGLCRSCHGLKTNEDKAHVGPWPNVLDKEDAAPKKKWVF